MGEPKTKRNKMRNRNKKINNNTHNTETYKRIENNKEILLRRKENKHETMKEKEYGNAF